MASKLKKNMVIELLERQDYLDLLYIARNYPKLFYGNRGYDTLQLSSLSEEERFMHEYVSEVLKKCIHGFSKFNHFRDKCTIYTYRSTKEIEGRIQIRLQYKWDASFTGVGYVWLDELYFGFDESSNVNNS